MAMKKQSQNGLLLKLLGVAIAYQIMHQVFMWYTLRHEFDNEDECAASGSSFGKPLCLEAQLFRSWQRAADMDVHEDSNNLLEFRAAADTTPESMIHFSEDDASPAVVVAKAVASKAAQDARKQLEELFDGVLLALNNSTSVASMSQDLKGLQSTLQGRLENLPDAHKKLAEDTVAELDNQLHAMPTHVSFDDLYAEISKTLSSRSAITPWAQGLSALQEELQVASHQQLTPAQYQEQSSSTVQPWAQSLVDLQARLEGRKKELEKAHEAQHEIEFKRHHQSRNITNWSDFNQVYEDFMDSLKKSTTTVSPWAQGLIDIQAKLQKEDDEAAARRKKHAREREEEVKKLAGHATHASSAFHLRGVASLNLGTAQAHAHDDAVAAQATHLAWERNFSDHVRSIGKDLCSDPVRRDSPACAAFLQPAPSGHHLEKKNHMTHEQWTANISDAAEAYHRELCADPQRKRTAPCVAYEAKVTTQTSVVVKTVDDKKGLRGAGQPKQAMAWRVVKAWKSIPDPHADERKLITMTRSEVRHAHWAGMIPKVGVITIVPSGREARYLAHFVDNFLLQNYEGAKQLVLVYHHSDKEAQRLVQEHADGSYIKGVASHGSGEFPSSADLRYGAWASDADIIARWEFNEFHMPHQISTQVRAMALSGRPSSILSQSWPISSPNSTEAEVLGRENSLAGEAVWMREHWLPLSDTERSILQNSRAHQIVQVAEDTPAK